MPTETRLREIVKFLTQPVLTPRKAAPKEAKSWAGLKVGNNVELLEPLVVAGVGRLVPPLQLLITNLDTQSLTLTLPDGRSFKWTNRLLLPRLFKKAPKARLPKASRKTRPDSGPSTSS
jgi:hypothetical protein